MIAYRCLHALATALARILTHTKFLWGRVTSIISWTTLTGLLSELNPAVQQSLPEIGTAAPGDGANTLPHRIWRHHPLQTRLIFILYTTTITYRCMCCREQNSLLVFCEVPCKKLFDSKQLLQMAALIAYREAVASLVRHRQ